MLAIDSIQTNAIMLFKTMGHVSCFGGHVAPQSESDTSSHILCFHTLKAKSSFLYTPTDMYYYGMLFHCRDESSHGFIHLRITKQKNGYVLGQHSQPFVSLSEMIAYFCQYKLNVRGITHRCLQYPLPRWWKLWLFNCHATLFIIQINHWKEGVNIVRSCFQGKTLWI